MRAGGSQRIVVFPNFDMRGLEINPGQHITLTHPIPGDGNEPWNLHECLVEKINLKYERLKTTLECLEVGQTFGPIEFPGEVTVEIPFTEDLWVDSADDTTNMDGDDVLELGRNLGGINVATKHLVGRANMLDPATDPYIPLTGIIKAVQLKFEVTEGNNDGNPLADPPRINPPINGGVFKMTNDNWVMVSSTYEIFADALPWDDNIFGAGNRLGRSNGWKSTGEKRVDFDAVGIAYIDSVRATVAEIVLNIGRAGTAQADDDINELIKIYGRLGAKPWSLLVTYTLP